MPRGETEHEQLHLHSASSKISSVVGSLIRTDARHIFRDVTEISAERYAGVPADNGGPTPTVALLPGGLAVDAGDTAALPADESDLDGDGDTAEPLPFDQRGLPRVSGAAVDIGAFELVQGGASEVLFAVNAGGPAVADYTLPGDAVLDAAFVDLGPVDFVADAPRSPHLVAGGVFPSGADAVWSSNIPGPPSSADDPLVTTERFNYTPLGVDMVWVFDVGANRDVVVDLYFAELFTGTAAPGARRFDVDIEGGDLELDDFDVYAAAGNEAERLVVKSFATTVGDDGILDIRFPDDPLDGIENPKINAVVVRTPPADDAVAEAYGHEVPLVDVGGDLLIG